MKSLAHHAISAVVCAVLGTSVWAQQVNDFSIPLAQRIPVSEPLVEPSSEKKHLTFEGQSPSISRYVQALAYPSSVTQPVRIASSSSAAAPVSIHHNISSGFTLTNLNGDIADPSTPATLNGAQTVSLRWISTPTSQTEAYSRSETRLRPDLKNAMTARYGLHQTAPLFHGSKVTAMVESREAVDFQDSTFSGNMARIVLDQPLLASTTSIRVANTWQRETQRSNPAYERDMPALETTILWKYRPGGTLAFGIRDSDTDLAYLATVENRFAYLATLQQKVLHNTDLQLRAAYETVEATGPGPSSGNTSSDNLTISAQTSIRLVDTVAAGLALRYQAQDSTTAASNSSNVGVSISVNGTF